MKEVQAVKKQLQQLDVELRTFKEELLVARVGELEQAIHSPGTNTRPGTGRVLTASLCQSRY